MKRKILYLVMVAGCIIGASAADAQKGAARPRTIVTTDGEFDDMDSFIRLLLYSNELNVVGMIYSSSEFHYAGDGKGTLFTSNMPWSKNYGARATLRWLGTRWMQDFIDKYATVYSNLVKHDRNYPTPEHLKSIVRVGNIDFEGEMDHNTEGSDYIKKILLDNDPIPVYIQVWGGTNTVARALKSIEDDYRNTPQWEAIHKKVSDKTTLHIILDQDETYKKYVSVKWPDVTAIVNGNQFWCFAYPWNKMVPATIQPYLDGKWFAEHIKFDHGALAGAYFLWGDGQKLVNDSEHTQGDTIEARKKEMKRYAFISEGDSPSYLFLINTGLRNLENPSYGGWGGRFVQSKTNPRLWKDGTDVTDYNFFDMKDDAEFPQSRWIDAMQNDFAARADWCVRDYGKANHAPVTKLNSSKDLSAAAGTVVHLSGAAKDPDGNDLKYKWWQYKEAGTFHGGVNIDSPNNAEASFMVPADAKSGETVHIIFEVSDTGTPQLTRYQRVIVTVK
jgi:hypothetical protein